MASDTTAALRVIFGADTEQLDKALGHIQKKLRDTGKTLTKVGKQLSVAVTAPLAAIGATSFRTSAQFEASMAKVKAVSGATAEEFNTLKQQALDLGRSTVFTASNVADLQLEFSKLGFTAAQITKVTESTLYLAQATGSDLATAAEVAGATLRGFGLEAEQTQRVTDVMAASFSSSALDMSNFRESMKYVAPVAKAAGISLEETTAMLGALANSGVKGSQAGTALRRIISELGGTGGNVAEEISKLAQKGLNLADAKDEVGRSAQTALLILADSQDVTRQLAEDFLLADGAAGDMADTMNQTSQGALARMNSALEGAAISIGEKLAPTMNSLANFVERLANKFTDLSGTTQGIIIVIAAVAAAIGPVILLAGQFAFALANLAPTIALVSARLIQLKTVLLANPWFLLAAGIAAAGYALYQYANTTERVVTAKEKVDSLTVSANKAADEEALKVRNLVKAYKDAEEGTIFRKTAIEDLQKLAPDYFGDLDAENTKVEDLAKAYKKYKDQARAAAIQKAFGNRLAEVEAEALKAEAALLQMGVRVEDGFNIVSNRIGGASRETTQFLADLARRTDDLSSEQIGFDIGFAAASEEGRNAIITLAELGAESDTLNASIKRLQEGIDTWDEGTGKAGDTTKATTKRFTDFKLKTEGLSKELDKLAEAELKAYSQDLLDPDDEKLFSALAKAYGDAAGAAAEFADLELSRELFEQSQAFQQASDKAKLAKDSQTDLLDTMHKLGFGASEVATTSIPELLNALEEVDTKTSNTAANVDKTMETLADHAQSIVESFLNFFDNFAQGIGRAVEEARASGEKMRAIGAIGKEAFASVLDALGGILIQVGKQAIATGTAIKAIKEALKNLNPAVAIAAGIALIALAGAVRGNLSKSADGMGVPKLARGGITTGEQLALVGDNPSGKEAIIPFERMGEFLRMAAPSQQVIVTGRISGNDILLSNERTRSNRLRNTGY